MESTLYLILIILISYFIGSFPSAVIISKRFFGFDIRQRGSKNMGSTNAFRVLGWKWGIVVQLLDILKGVIPVLLIANWLGPQVSLPFGSGHYDLIIIRIIAGIAAILGHIFSVFVNFRGGKGINTAAGMLIAILPIEFGIGIGIFIIAVMFSGYISLGSIFAAFTIPSSLFIRHSFCNVEIPGYNVLINFSLVLLAIVIYTHWSNIIRLINGEENRFNSLHIIKLSNKNKDRSSDD